jgi:hypothetical protein
MDPSDNFPPPPAFFPPPAPAAAAPPPASTAASFAGPLIFVLSPLPGNKYEVDWYFYSPRADVTTGDYAALLTFTTHYAYSLAILQCPDLAAFQASYPAATVRPFSKVPPPIIERGRALLISSAVSTASPSGGSASSQSLLSLSSSCSSSAWGHDPPLVAAVTRTSSVPVSRSSALPPPPRRPDPDGVDGPSSVFRMGGSGGSGSLVGRGGLGGRVFVVPPLAVPLPLGSLLPPPTERFGPTTFRVPFRRQFLPSSSTITGLLHLLADIPTSLHLWRIPMLTQFLRCVLCPVGISLPRLLRTSLYPVGLLPLLL